ncbi:MAG: ROK family protein [Deltaproteobacteria bacterium]|nr:ROK family protein [Deltaproteobacteria bacterium]MBW2359316.1 ROK family protein [Deltaproteobacteria bacterium]
MSEFFGIDIGGSGIKGAPVDLSCGELADKRKRIKTPQPATPKAVADVAAQLLEHFEASGPVGCALPSVVQRGVVLSAANIDDAWIGVEGEKLFSKRLGRPVRLLNDADAAGLAEMRFGAGRDEPGLVLMLTFGTGIGSALVYKGELVPNTELGHAQFRGMEAEEYVAARLVKREDMKIDWWASRVNELLAHFERLFSPDLIVFGGGISKRFEEFSMHLETRARLLPARLGNNAGIVGAALAARDAA